MYSVFGLSSKVVGISIRVVKMILSIIKGLGFLGNHCRGFV